MEKYRKREDVFYTLNKDKINELSDKAENYSKIINDSINGDTEPDFLSNNKDKKILINFINGKQREGILEGISNFGIIIKNQEGKDDFYYKHSIESYYIIE